MSKKKSYMNPSNIIKEGVFSKIMSLIVKGKAKKVAQALQGDKELQRLSKKAADSAAEFEKALSKAEKNRNKALHKI